VAGKDPIEFRLELLDRVIKNPVGKDHDYDAKRYAQVLKLLRDKSGWGKAQPNVSRGLSIYYCHNSYAAQVVDVKFEKGKLVIPRVCCVIDLCIVVNPDAATNLTEGAIVDGIGNALYGGIILKDGVPNKTISIHIG
jgi:isoquinoline 1-oxidoreductase beta subunit